MGEVEVFRALSDVPARRWDAAVPPGRGALWHGFLAPCERILDRGTWRTFTFSRSGSSVLTAISAGVIHRVDLAASLPATGRWVAAAARCVRPDALRPRVLELGPPGWPGPPVSGPDPGAVGEGAERILDAAWHHVAAEGQADALLVRDFAGPELTPLECRLEARGFALVARRPTFVAHVQVPSLDAHLASMRADYRRRAQRYLQADLRVRITADFAAQAEAIARLCALTTGRSRESRRERVDADVVRGWARCPHTRAVLIEDRNGHLELAALVLEDPPALHFIRVGFDDRSGRQRGVYPRLLYELCRYAIAQRLSYVDFGLTSADPKLRAGAQPIPLRVWARHRHPAVQAILRAASPRLIGAETSPTRHVFRAPPPPVDPHWYGEGAS
jgi:hypothetical protein